MNIRVVVVGALSLAILFSPSLVFVAMGPMAFDLWRSGGFPMLLLPLALMAQCGLLIAAALTDARRPGLALHLLGPAIVVVTGALGELWGFDKVMGALDLVSPVDFTTLLYAGAAEAATPIFVALPLASAGLFVAFVSGLLAAFRRDDEGKLTDAHRLNGRILAAVCGPLAVLAGAAGVLLYSVSRLHTAFASSGAESLADVPHFLDVALTAKHFGIGGAVLMSLIGVALVAPRASELGVYASARPVSLGGAMLALLVPLAVLTLAPSARKGAGQRIVTGAPTDVALPVWTAPSTRLRFAVGPTLIVADGKRPALEVLAPHVKAGTPHVAIAVRTDKVAIEPASLASVGAMPYAPRTHSIEVALSSQKRGGATAAGTPVEMQYGRALRLTDRVSMKPGTLVGPHEVYVTDKSGTLSDMVKFIIAAQEEGKGILTFTTAPFGGHTISKRDNDRKIAFDALAKLGLGGNNLEIQRGTAHRVGGSQGGLGGRGAGMGLGIGGVGGLRTPQNDRGQIKPGKVTAKGAVSKDEISRVMRRVLPQLRFCYEKELAKSPTLGGKVVAQFTIAGTGLVRGAKVQQDTVGSAAVSKCILRVVKRLRFPKPRGGGQVLVDYPMVFSSKG